MPELMSYEYRLGRLKQERSVKTNCWSTNQLEELDRLISECESLGADALKDKTRDGSCNHPFGQSPFKTLQAISRVEKAERLILTERTTTERANNNRYFSPGSFLYPSIKVTVARQSIMVMLSIRTRLSNSMAFRYDQPSLMEVLFIKSPTWMGHFLVSLLPDHRRVSAYPPEPRSHPTSRRRQLLDLLSYYRAHPFQVWKFPFAIARILIQSGVKRA